MAKINNRKASQVPHAPHLAAPGAPTGPGVPTANLTAPGPRQPAIGMGGQMIHHHHDPPGGGPPSGADDVSGMFHHQQM